MKLTIITVNLNNRGGLRCTAQSVVEQTFQDFEWFVIDGGSVDGSCEVMGEFASRITWSVSEPKFFSIDRRMAKSNENDLVMWVPKVNGPILSSNDC